MKTVSFPECVRNLMAAHSLSLSELSSLLGYKSRTTLARILSGDSGSASLQKTCDDLCSCEALALTDSEKAQLTEALSVSLEGEDAILTRREMWKLLLPAERTPSDVRILNSSVYSTLSQLFSDLKGVESDFCILNCAVDSVSGLLEEFLRDPDVSVRIRHYIQFQPEPDQTIRSIRCILPLLSDSRYTAYSWHLPEEALRNTMNRITIRGGNGSSWHILLLTETEAILANSSGALADMDTFLEFGVSVPLKTVSGSADGNFVEFMDIYRRLEEGRDIYKFKPDLCICYISAEIVKNAFLDGCKDHGISVPMEAVRAMTDIHLKRYQNIFTQNHATHLVLTRSAMTRFAESGLQSDHLYFMRPYTVWERIAILSNCLSSLTSNPFFHLYLLKPEDEERLSAINPTELACYGRDTVHITPALTNYNLHKGHSEVILPDEKLADITGDFFRKELIPNHTLPASDTVAFLESLLTALTETL